MTLNDPLSNVLSNILNAEKVGKKEYTANISSKMILKVLGIMRDNRYIGEFKETEYGNKSRIHINLLGKINKCSAIKPRFSIKIKDMEKYEKRYLPAKDFGIIILSTNKGLITHKEAKEQGKGGRLISYIY
ncbi:30S ribosomal protein S8 [Candidatus Woesearchaeota archaeon]|nr:30S ribosomal protein S8 [uncultured archaeon]MBS3150603.1 30S ribosomal protein S8 [Candidatus Woesearchaeota archaeon]